MRNQSFHTLEDNTKIDMTPMLDIIFIMLIFFIVTASFLRETGLPLPIPEGDSQHSPEKVSLIVQVSETNEVLFNARHIDIRAVAVNLKREISELDNPSVIIHAHPGAKTDIVLQVVDRVRAAGIRDFVVVPLKEN